MHKRLRGCPASRSRTRQVCLPFHAPGTKKEADGGLPFLSGEPGEIRTPNLLIRSQVHYPVMLRVRANANGDWRHSPQRGHKISAPPMDRQGKRAGKLPPGSHLGLAGPISRPNPCAAGVAAVWRCSPACRYPPGCSGTCSSPSRPGCRCGRHRPGLWESRPRPG